MVRSIVVILVLVTASALHAFASQPLQSRKSVDLVEQLIEAATAGETVALPDGVYEGNLIIRKPVVIDGTGASIVFDGLGVGTVIAVLADGVTIRGVTIRGSGDDVPSEPAGVRVGAANVTLENNTIEDVLFGIDLRESPNARIRGNTIRGKNLEPGRRGDGIRLWWSHGCVVEDNVVQAMRDMIFWYSEDLRVSGNTVSDSRYGLHFMYSHGSKLTRNDLYHNSVGVYLMYSNDIELHENRIRDNRGASGYGIGLKDCDDIVITSNALLANRVGVYIDNSPSSVGSTGLFESNMIAFNEIGLLATPNSHDNVFTGNAFLENEESAATHGRGRLTLNLFERDHVGNYWSDYAGFDLDRDGIGDLPYEPRSLFGAMLADEPNLRLFVHSPVQQAIEFTARALPELRPESTLTDPAPLARPPRIELSFPAGGSSRGAMGVLAAALLLTAGGGAAWLGRGQRLPVSGRGDH